MELPLTYYGDPVLRKRGEVVQEITKEIDKLIEDMIDTMEANNGAGIAAPQVGRSLRIFVTCCSYYDENGELVPGTLRVFINPEILEVSDQYSQMTEGCLSIPTIHADVIRPANVKVKALDRDGKEFIGEYSGLEAHCVLHENDHINGVLFIDRIKSKEKKTLDTKLRKVKEQYYLRQKKK